MAHLLMLLLLLLLLVVMMLQCLLETGLLLRLLLLDPLIGHHQKGHIKGAFQSGLSTGWRCGCLMIIVIMTSCVILLRRLLWRCGDPQLGVLGRRGATLARIRMRRQAIHEQIHFHFKTLFDFHWLLVLWAFGFWGLGFSSSLRFEIPVSTAGRPQSVPL